MDVEVRWQLGPLHLPHPRRPVAEDRAPAHPELRYRMCGSERYLPRSTARPRHPDRQYGNPPRSVHRCPSPVASLLSRSYSSGESKPFIRNVFTLNTCSHIVGSQVLSFDDEIKLFNAWQKFVEEVDPDVVIGYNIANFDLPYLLDRAKTLKADKFPLLGRLKGQSFPPLCIASKLLMLVVQATRHRRRRHTSRPRRSASATPRTPSSMDACKSTCSSTCSASTSCAATR